MCRFLQLSAAQSIDSERAKIAERRVSQGFPPPWFGLFWGVGSP
jgi:hypothetical protein